ncbi:hypothetical protein lerEdw1_019236 [Lerista edwardsae]|nr:hypothetical protein lerEdw1_019236 [Lerista edwardsae]
MVRLSLAFFQVAAIHPECKIFQQVVKDEARCLEKKCITSTGLQRNCTPGTYWSEPHPPYAVACGFEESLTNGPEDQDGEKWEENQVKDISCLNFVPESSESPGKECESKRFASIMGSFLKPYVFYTTTLTSSLVVTKGNQAWTPRDKPSPCASAPECSLSPPQKSYYSAFWHVYTAGYATSLASLITALLIFAFFR